MERYWSQVEELHKNHHIVSGLAIEIDAQASFLQLIEHARSLVCNVIELRDILIESDDALAGDIIALMAKLRIPESELEQYREQTVPFQARNWEVLNLGITNTVSKLQVILSQMEIRYLEEFLKLTPNDSLARLRLNELKREFETIATSAGYVD